MLHFDQSIQNMQSTLLIYITITLIFSTLMQEMLFKSMNVKLDFFGLQNGIFGTKTCWYLLGDINKIMISNVFCGGLRDRNFLIRTDTTL